MHRARPSLAARALGVVLTVVALVVVSTGCTTHDTGGALDLPSGGVASGTSSLATGAGPGKPCRDAQPPGTKGEPTVLMPTQAPADLSISDLRPGDGATAKIGSVLTVQYVGVACSTGRRFDSTWERHKPYTFTLAATSNLLPGWLAGLEGMKVGGERLLMLPPDQAYGANPPVGSGIAPGETLVYVVDLTAVN